MMCKMTQWAAINCAFALELGCFIPCYVVSVCYQSYTVAISLVPDPCLVCFLHLTCNSVLLLVWLHSFLLNTACGSWEGLIASKDSWLETVPPCWLWALILCHYLWGPTWLSWSALLHKAEFTYAFRRWWGPAFLPLAAPLEPQARDCCGTSCRALFCVLSLYNKHYGSDFWCEFESSFNTD